jgi:hypothetical protein
MCLGTSPPFIDTEFIAPSEYGHIIIMCNKESVTASTLPWATWAPWLSQASLW